MSRTVARHLRRAALMTLTMAAALGGVTAAASADDVTVVTNGLANPRGLTVTHDGRHLLVAEAGKGGPGPCVTAGDPQSPPQCYGPTGAITAVDVASGRRQAIVSGLPSLAPQTGPTPGGDAIGPQDVSLRHRRPWFTVGLAANPAVRANLGPAGPDFAGVYRISRGHVLKVADLGAYEAANNPDAGQPSAEVDTNPFSIDARFGVPLVTDAGGNDLLAVTPGGRVATLAVFPFGRTPAPPSLNLPAGTQVPYQPVPTGVVRGRDGAAYVGQLTGFPFPADAANVFRVADVHGPSVVVKGFTTIVDVAFGPDRALYVLQISSTGLAGPPSPGRLLRIGADGTRTELAAGRLVHPTGLTIARDGSIYVSDNGGSPTAGRIVRIDGAASPSAVSKRHRGHR